MRKLEKLLEVFSLIPHLLGHTKIFVSCLYTCEVLAEIAKEFVKGSAGLLWCDSRYYSRVSAFVAFQERYLGNKRRGKRDRRTMGFSSFRFS